MTTLARRYALKSRNEVWFISEQKHDKKLLNLSMKAKFMSPILADSHSVCVEMHTLEIDNIQAIK